MIRYLLGFALAAVSACGAQVAPKPPSQTPPSTPTGPQLTPRTPGNSAPDTSAAVPPATPIITVKGVCAPSGSASSAGPCTTTVTKEQFERLLNALNSSNQNIAPAMRRNLAQAYVELLAYAQAAEKAGIEKDSKFIEVMRLVRMRTLADLYRRDLEEKYRNPPEAEIQAHYNQNVQRYEEIKLSRIFIPAKNPSAQTKDDWEKKAAQVATDIHDRAAKGEDLEKLQKEAYTTLGLTIAPPTTALGARRRGTLSPTDEQELFALKPGEVSKVEQEPAGYIVYKVESKQTLPMEQVKDEISRELFRQKLDAQLKSVTGSVQAEFNDQYFGPPAAPPGAATGPSPNPPAPARPPSGTQPPKTPPK